MPCTCLSRKRKERSPSNPPPQQTLLFKQPQVVNTAFNSSQVEEKVKQLISHIPASSFVRFTISRTGAPALEMELPPPIRPESIVGFSLDPVPTYENYPPDAKESYLQETPGLHEMMPKHPNSAGLIRRSCGAIPKKLMLWFSRHPTLDSAAYFPRAHSDVRQVQLAISARIPLFKPLHELDTIYWLLYLKFDPTVRHSATTSAWGTSYTTTYPPPNVPLPPIPAASPSTTWPQRTYSLSMTSRPPSTKGLVRDFPYPQDFHPAVLDTVPPTSRPRSKSSPLRSEMKPTSSHAALPTSRRMRFLSSPYSFNSDSEITDETNPTSEEGEPITYQSLCLKAHIPHPSTTKHSKLASQYHPSTRFSSQKLPNLENLQTCHDFSS
ncbi:hypothetical protein H4Q26_008962 [Puccinia striiformis f. sp. tritici PST-130]|nr:hypothetical protein H4Q26_008962 [Puccinia striiformis f. sp. tritici PST-130]